MTSHDHIKVQVQDVGQVVYIRAISAEELGMLLPANALDDLSGHDDLFSVTTEDGVRVAIVEGRENAFAAATAYDLQPVSVH